MLVKLTDSARLQKGPVLWDPASGIEYRSFWLMIAHRVFHDFETSTNLDTSMLAHACDNIISTQIADLERGKLHNVRGIPFLWYSIRPRP